MVVLSVITLTYRSRAAVRDHLFVCVVTVPSPITLTHGNSAGQMGSSVAFASRLYNTQENHM
jgi:hypothetical protein